MILLFLRKIFLTPSHPSRSMPKPVHKCARAVPPPFHTHTHTLCAILPFHTLCATLASYNHFSVDCYRLKFDNMPNNFSVTEDWDTPTCVYQEGKLVQRPKTRTAGTQTESWCMMLHPKAVGRFTEVVDDIRV